MARSTQFDENEPETEYREYQRIRSEPEEDVDLEDMFEESEEEEEIEEEDDGA